MKSYQLLTDENLNNFANILEPDRYSKDAVDTVLNMIFTCYVSRPIEETDFFYREYWNKGTDKQVRKICKILGIKAKVNDYCVSIKNSERNIPEYIYHIIFLYDIKKRNENLKDFIDDLIGSRPSLEGIPSEKIGYYKYLV